MAPKKGSFRRVASGAMRASFLRLVALTLSCSHGEAARPSRSLSAGLQPVDRPVIPGLSWVNMSYFLQNMSEICVDGNRTCPEVEYRMIGWEPQGGAQLPVYIFTSGGGVWPTGFNSSTPDLILCEEMARRGYMAVMAELPQLPILSCDSLSNNSLPYYADLVFSYHGQHDTRSFGALATACRRSTVNCNTGIALHGHSVGGHLSNLAPQFAVGITALLIWGMGSRQPFGGSCCGLVRSPPNSRPWPMHGDERAHTHPQFRTSTSITDAFATLPAHTHANDVERAVCASSTSG